MKYRKLGIATVIATVTIASALALWMFNPRVVSAEDDEARSLPSYNPDPPRILPPNLNSEIKRVLREIDFIEARASARWKALMPPTLTNQPPVLANTGTEAIETLGELMNYDRNISPKRNEACASCPMPYAAFSGPIPSVNLTMIAYPGTEHFRAGKRTAQRYPYAPFFPVLQYNQTQGAFFGGNFWDSRATGYLLRNPDANQAQGPPVDTYEQSLQVSSFTSKFDAFLAGNYTLTADEKAGYDLFRGKGNCNSCHLDGRSTAPTPANGTAPNGEDTGAAADTRPLFTCFGSANLGLPLNPRNAFYYQTKPDPYGFTANPLGFGYRDLGLGEFLRSGFGTWASPNESWRQYAPQQDGRMQTSSARNVAMVPAKCTGGTDAPGPYFQKEFFHNGYIKSLKQLVHFYNTRDKKGYAYPVTSGHCPPGTTERVDCWPEPEVRNNLDMTTGDLGLTDKEEDQIVAFLQTLTDGYTRPYPNKDDVYTGRCMVGGT